MISMLTRPVFLFLFYLLALAVAGAFSGNDVYFLEGEPVESFSVLAHVVAFVVYLIKRRPFGFFPAMVLLVMIDRELTWMMHTLRDQGLYHYYHPLITGIALFMVALLFMERRRVFSLLTDAKRDLPLSVSLVALGIISASLSFLSEKVTGSLWLEETSELLFALLCLYGVIFYPRALRD